MKIKVCGMRESGNIAEIAALKPDYMGFVFYERSPRYVGDMLPEVLEVLQPRTKRVGVFVNASIPKIRHIAHRYSLDMIQLHGEETPDFCAELQGNYLVVKAFGIEAAGDFGWVAPYAGSCDHFLFDTKSILRGGSGRQFDHSLLSFYDGEMTFILSGGISLQDAEKMDDIHEKCIALDVNSQFEYAPGLKNPSLITDFITTIRKNK